MFAVILFAKFVTHGRRAKVVADRRRVKLLADGRPVRNRRGWLAGWFWFLAHILCVVAAWLGVMSCLSVLGWGDMRLPFRRLGVAGWGDWRVVPEEFDARHLVLLFALISASILALDVGVAAGKPPKMPTKPKESKEPPTVRHRQERTEHPGTEEPPASGHARSD